MMSRCSAEILFFAGWSTFRAEKFHGLGAVDGAPSTCCAKHSSVNFFVFFRATALRDRKNLSRPSEGLRRPPGAFRSLPKTFPRKIKFYNFPSFFMKVQHKIVFRHGRGKFLNNFIWDFVRKETAPFRAWAISWSQFRTSFDPS